MSSYLIKWKGVKSGPFTESQLHDKLAAREISGMHEVEVNGEWLTVRAFLKGRQTETPKRIEEPQPSQTPLAPPPFSILTNESDRALASPPEDPEREVLIYAGFWQRFLAYGFDQTIINGLPHLIIAAVFSNPLFSAGGGTSLPGFLMIISTIILNWIYFAGMESSYYRATLGKLIVGLVVTDEKGHPISFQAASGRHFAKILSALMVGAGFFLAAFTKNKQAFHDLLADSLVCLAVPQRRILKN